MMYLKRQEVLKCKVYVRVWKGSYEDKVLNKIAKLFGFGLCQEKCVSYKSVNFSTGVADTLVKW